MLNWTFPTPIWEILKTAMKPCSLCFTYSISLVLRPPTRGVCVLIGIVGPHPVAHYHITFQAFQGCTKYSASGVSQADILERCEPSSVLRYSDGYSHFLEIMLCNFKRFYMMDIVYIEYICVLQILFFRPAKICFLRLFTNNEQKTFSLSNYCTTIFVQNMCKYVIFTVPLWLPVLHKDLDPFFMVGLLNS
jgi:hypothetical protein